MAEDTWSETAFVSISKIGGSDVEFATITETVDVDFGNKEFDVINTLKGGRLVKFNPQEPSTVTLEAYPIEAGTASGTEGKGFMDLLYASDATQPLSINFDRTRTKVRIAILWTDDTNVTTATDAISEGSNALRIVLKNGYVTSAKPSFTDGILKYNVTIKCPAFDKSANPNGLIESTDGSTSAILAELSAYTA